MTLPATVVTANTIAIAAKKTPIVANVPEPAPTTDTSTRPPK